MASDTQMMDTCSPSTPIAGPTVTGYLMVPPQGPLLAARHYPVKEGNYPGGCLLVCICSSSGGENARGREERRTQLT